MKPGLKPCPHILHLEPILLILALFLEPFRHRSFESFRHETSKDFHLPRFFLQFQGGSASEHNAMSTSGGGANSCGGSLTFTSQKGRYVHRTSRYVEKTPTRARTFQRFSYKLFPEQVIEKPTKTTEEKCRRHQRHLLLLETVPEVVHEWEACDDSLPGTEEEYLPDKVC